MKRYSNRKTKLIIFAFCLLKPGKSTCDALSAVVKRVVRIKSLYAERPITTPERMFEVATNELSTDRLEFIYVTHADVQHYRESLLPRYSRVRTIPGTQQFHFLSVLQDKKLLTKRYGNSTNFQAHDVLQPLPDETAEEMEIDQEEPAQHMIPQIGEFYALAFGNTYQIGRAVENFFDTSTTKFMMMRKAGQGGIALNWPLSEKFQDFEFSKIIAKVSTPYYYDPKKNYRLQADDLAVIHNAGY